MDYPQRSYEFTQDWFSTRIGIWQAIFSGRPSPKRVLEIGSYEGRSTVWVAENLLADDGEIIAVDAWNIRSGTYAGEDMAAIEARFDHNVAAALSRRPLICIEKRKGESMVVLASLLASGGRGSFDLIYVDGDHKAPTVLSDLVLAFHLCAAGGLIFCDDYLWNQDLGLTQAPKLAIDAFVSCLHDKLRILEQPLYQLYLQKIAD